MFFFISLYMQNVLGFSAIEAGLAYLPLAVSIIISAGVASQIVTRIGFKPILALGMLLIAGGLLWFGQISADGSFVADVLGAARTGIRSLTTTRTRSTASPPPRTPITQGTTP